MIHTRGFTLIEIIVVLSLIGIMLFFSAPRMEGFLSKDESRAVSRWIVLNIAELKKTSVETQNAHILYVDLDGNRFQIARSFPENRGEDFFTASGTETPDAVLSDQTPRETEKTIFELPGGYRLTSVHFSREKLISSGTAAIRFSPKGYSDQAIIHMIDNANRRKSYRIDAFLPKVKIHDDHVTF